MGYDGENRRVWVQDGVGRREYSYDLLGRVVQSVEHPSGDTTVYTYTPAGRLASEVRTGQVAYSRSYGYNPDGSRAEVMRSDVLNGTHWDFYFYEAASGRLQSVLDVWTGEVNEFVWNPEGTLARWWNSEPNSYARVFGYDEEGRLTKIERDYGNGNLQTAYEYEYSADGVRVWKQDWLNGQEYRYVCRIGCDGVPMRVYNRAIGGASWASVEDYLPAGNALGYDNNWRYIYSGVELLMMGASGEPSGYYPMDGNGVWVQSELPAPCKCPVVAPAAPSVCPPLGYGGCEEGNNTPGSTYNPSPCGWNPECLADCTLWGIGAILSCFARCAGWGGLLCVGLVAGCMVVCSPFAGGLTSPLCIRCLSETGRRCIPIIMRCLFPCVAALAPVITACILGCYGCPPPKRRVGPPVGPPIYK